MHSIYSNHHKTYNLIICVMSYTLEITILEGISFFDCLLMNPHLTFSVLKSLLRSDIPIIVA